MQGRKPANLKVVASNDIRMTDPGDLPLLPAHIDVSMEPEWTTTVKSLRNRGLLADDIMPMVETYILAIWMQRKAMKVIDDDGLTFTVKKTGEIKKHPATTELKAAREDAIRIAVELGLTPSSKSRRGLGGEEKPESPAERPRDGTPPGLVI